MHFIIIGLGNFGLSMARKLTLLGHDVIGVDTNQQLVEEYKNLMDSTIALNSVDMTALRTLPLREVDIVIVTIGQSLSTSIETVAALKQLGVKRIIARSTSEVHKTVLDAIRIEYVINPEQYAAEAYCAGLGMEGFVGIYNVDFNHRVYEFKIPFELVGKQVGEVGFNANFKLKLIALKRLQAKKNIFGNEYQEYFVFESLSDETIFEFNDVILVYGTVKDFHKMKKVI